MQKFETKLLVRATGRRCCEQVQRGPVRAAPGLRRGRRPARLGARGLLGHLRGARRELRKSRHFTNSIKFSIFNDVVIVLL